ncbi:MAG: dTMP kinase [Alphaproteobacteria bacterium]|nr:dTMP kinase [Alphaproteobacteria bacterium]
MNSALPSDPFATLPIWHRLIVLEGINGAGKTSQLTGLDSFLQREFASKKFVRAAQPGSQRLGGMVRAVIEGDHSNGIISSHSALLLFLADRHELFAELRTEHPEGAFLLMDRHIDSCWAYNGVLDGCPVEQLVDYHFHASIPRAGLTILLDVAPEVAFARSDRGDRAGRGDRHSRAELHILRDAYLRLAEHSPLHHVIDAGAGYDVVQSAVRERVIAHIT